MITEVKAVSDNQALEDRVRELNAKIGEFGRIQNLCYDLDARVKELERQVDSNGDTCIFLEADVEQLKIDVDELQSCGICCHDDGDFSIIENDISDLQDDVAELQDKLNCSLRGCQFECGLDHVVNVILQKQKRLDAAIRVLYRLIDYNRETDSSILDHLFINQRPNRVALLESVNAAVRLWHSSADFYDNLAAMIDNEIAEMKTAKK